LISTGALHYRHDSTTEMWANSRLALTGSSTRRCCQKLVQTDLLISGNLIDKFLEGRVTGLFHD
jgi:hypothetical protein